MFRSVAEIDEALHRLGRRLLYADAPAVTIVVCGGSGLHMLGLSSRTTRDIDICAAAIAGETSLAAARNAQLPAAFLTAVEAVARDLGLSPGWLNTAAGDRSMKWKKIAASMKPPAHAPSVPLFFRAAKTVRTRRQQDGVFAAYGLARAPVVIRGQAQPIHFRSPAAILCTSRALFGVAIRADVMAYLAVNERGHARGLAATLGYNHMQVRAVLLSLEQAGIATAVSYGRTHHYSIDMEAWRALLMEPGMTAQWINWRCLGRGFNSMFAGLWAIDASRADATVAESLVRDVMEAAREDILGTHAEMAHQRGLSRILGTSLADKIGTGANRRLHSPGRTL